MNLFSSTKDNKMRHVDDMLARYPILEILKEDLELAISLLWKSLRGGGKILACGNGGSAADAEHLVGELMKGFHLKRKLTKKQVAEIATVFPFDAEMIASDLQQGIPAISLVSHTALSTAIINDMNPLSIFSQQVFSLGMKDDILIIFSTSGNSQNVVNAAKIAKAKKINVIALTGRTGGEVKNYSDVCLRVPADRVDIIQELHLPLYHCLCASIEQIMFGDGSIPKLSNLEVSNENENSFLKKVGLVVFDFDGVFTDNKVFTTQDGIEIVRCDRSDSLGIDKLKTLKVPSMILSKEENPVVAVRGAKLGISVECGCDDKAKFLREYAKKKNIELSTIVYFGNDINDFEVMSIVGYPVATGDAHSSVKEIARLVIPQTGGAGAVRALCEFLEEKLI